MKSIIIVLEVKDPFSKKKETKTFVFENMSLKDAMIELNRRFAYLPVVWSVKAIYLNGYKLQKLNSFSKGV